MAETGSYTRRDQPRSVPDTLAGPYAQMVALQRAYNARQAESFMPSVNPARTTRTRHEPEGEIIELRRKQEEFKKTTRALDRENAVLAIPALAPVAAVLGLEGAAYVGGLLAPTIARRAPLVLQEAEPYLRVGDNWATRAGRRAHAALKEWVAQKPGWQSEPSVRVEGRVLKPDVRTPSRIRSSGEQPTPFQMELKPNTPTGRKAAARAIKKYEATEVKTRPIYYDQKPFI